MAEVGIDSCLVTAAKIPEAAPPTSSQCPDFANTGIHQLCSALEQILQEELLPALSFASWAHLGTRLSTEKCILNPAHMRGMTFGMAPESPPPQSSHLRTWEGRQ
jgi:hypothetical protein